MSRDRRPKPPQAAPSSGRADIRSAASLQNGILVEKVSFLSSPAAYGSVDRCVETRETHLSWVFLTRDLVYKLKKPIRLPHLDFSTIERRRFYCEEELRLNSRLAPDAYLDLVPLRRDRSGGFRLGSARGRVVDWLVKMRRLPQADMLDRRFETGALVSSDLEDVASMLVAFYACRTPEEAGTEAYALHLRREQDINRKILLQPRFGLAGQAGGVVGRVDTLMKETAPLIEERVAAGAVLEGHGDLRPEHVCLASPPQIIDCLEFNRTMRLVDPYDEVNYLGMECDMLGAGWIRPLLNAALPSTGIAPPEPELLALYAVFRCLLRAIAHLLERPIRHPTKWRPLALRYLRQGGRELVNLQSR